MITSSEQAGWLNDSRKQPITPVGRDNHLLRDSLCMRIVRFLLRLMKEWQILSNVDEVRVTVVYH